MGSNGYKHIIFETEESNLVESCMTEKGKVKAKLARWIAYLPRPVPMNHVMYLRASRCPRRHLLGKFLAQASSTLPPFQHLAQLSVPRSFLLRSCQVPSFSHGGPQSGQPPDVSLVALCLQELVLLSNPELR